MGKLKVDGCIRCKNGDVALDKDQYGWYEYCLQCGHISELSGAFNKVEVKGKAALKSRRCITTLRK